MWEVTATFRLARQACHTVSGFAYLLIKLVIRAQPVHSCSHWHNVICTMWSAQAQLIWIKPENKKAENHNGGGELVCDNK